jgi:hypothetical protein
VSRGLQISEVSISLPPAVERDDARVSQPVRFLRVEITVRSESATSVLTVVSDLISIAYESGSRTLILDLSTTGTASGPIIRRVPTMIEIQPLKSATILITLPAAIKDFGAEPLPMPRSEHDLTGVQLVKCRIAYTEGVQSLGSMGLRERLEYTSRWGTEQATLKPRIITAEQ